MKIFQCIIRLQIRQRTPILDLSYLKYLDSKFLEGEGDILPLRPAQNLHEGDDEGKRKGKYLFWGPLESELLNLANLRSALESESVGGGTTASHQHLLGVEQG